MKFPYLEYKGRFLPIIPISFRHKDEWIEFYAYVDSGAAFSIFHSRVAKLLGLKLERGTKGYVTVGDGREMLVYVHQVAVKISNIKFKARIGFSRRLNIGFNIIGRLDIFNRFVICFNEKKRVVGLYSVK